MLSSTFSCSVCGWENNEAHIGERSLLLKRNQTIFPSIRFCRLLNLSPPSTRRRERDYSFLEPATPSSISFSLSLPRDSRCTHTIVFASGRRKFVSRLGARHDTTMMRIFPLFFLGLDAGCCCCCFPNRGQRTFMRTINREKLITHPSSVWRAPFYAKHISM